MIATFSEYIETYILETGGLHIPGEHHFVSVYLVPRLAAIDFLRTPDYVNPDGMKSIPGDIVFYDRAEAQWRYRLGIEVKLGSIKFSRVEYNDWMCEGSTAVRPHLFVGIDKEGILFGDWEQFAERFKSVAYPNGTAPGKLSNRYTAERALSKVAHDTELVLPEVERRLPAGLTWLPYSANLDSAKQSETEFIETLSDICNSVLMRCPRRTGGS